MQFTVLENQVYVVLTFQCDGDVIDLTGGNCRLSELGEVQYAPRYEHARTNIVQDKKRFICFDS